MIDCCYGQGYADAAIAYNKPRTLQTGAFFWKVLPVGRDGALDTPNRWRDPALQFDSATFRCNEGSIP